MALLANVVSIQGEDQTQNQYEVKFGDTVFLGDVQFYKDFVFRVETVSEPEMVINTYDTFFKGLKRKNPAPHDATSKEVSMRFRSDKNAVYVQGFIQWLDLVYNRGSGVKLDYVSAVTGQYNYSTSITVQSIDAGGLRYGNPNVYQGAFPISVSAAQRDMSSSGAVTHDVRFVYLEKVVDTASL